tara:strand:+ start:233 stop:466 length:234 start_codon:yes stop_codon:yes gene_type:complete
MKKTKLIWDFRGPYGKNTAIHYEKHLREFFIVKKIKLIKSGIEVINESHHSSYVIILNKNLDKVKLILKPNRVEILI